MESSPRHPNPKILSKFKPLNALNSVQLELLSKFLTIQSVPQGQVLLQIGETRDNSLFLLSGRLKLQSSDDRSYQIDHLSPQAEGPIANLKPRQYQVTSLTEVEYLLVEDRILDGLISSTPDGIQATEILSQEHPHSLDDTENQLLQILSEDLSLDRLVLPTLPDVAVRVGQAIRDETTHATKLAKIIQTDPAITTKLIHAANSPLYGGVTTIDSCKEAVVRLGLQTAHKLVITFALRELFNTRSAKLKYRMKQLWEHSVKVSAICYVLAKLGKQFNAEHALLAGLLHDIGVVAILSYAERFPELVNSGDDVDLVTQDMRGQIGAEILKTWHFNQDLVTAALEAENWMRDEKGPADYADLVIVAQSHCYIGSTKMCEMPSIDQIPALKKLQINEFTPKLSIKILDKAQEKIARAESLLRS